MKTDPTDTQSVLKFAPSIGVLLVILEFLMFLSASGQPPSQKFTIGVKAAPTLTVARYRDRDLQDEFKPRFVIGYSLGAQVKFPLKNEYSFISELAISQKGRNTIFNTGGRNKGTYAFADGSMALRRSFKLKLFKNVPTNLFFNVGPNIEYWLMGKGRLVYNTGGKATYDIAFDQPRTSDFSHYYYNEVNRWLFGIDLGVGGDAPITRRQRVYGEFRVTWGQTQLGKKNSTSFIELVPLPSDNLKASLKTISMIFSYTLDFDMRESKKGKSTKDKAVKRKR